jgi:hypothetical protein
MYGIKFIKLNTSINMQLKYALLTSYLIDMNSSQFH